MKKKYIGKINGIDYNTYINSLEWREKRTEVAERAKYKCIIKPMLDLDTNF